MKTEDILALLRDLHNGIVWPGLNAGALEQRLSNAILDLSAPGAFRRMTQDEQTQLIAIQCEDIRGGVEDYAEEILDQCTHQQLWEMLHPTDRPGDEENS